MKRLTVPLAAAATAVLLVGTTPASAASLSCSQAKSAVKRELKRSSFDNSPVAYVNRLTCRRLTSTRAKVTWQADTRHDVAFGNIDGHAGYATVRKYRYGTDVHLVVTDD